MGCFIFRFGHSGALTIMVVNFFMKKKRLLLKKLLLKHKGQPRINY